MHVSLPQPVMRFLAGLRRPRRWLIVLVLVALHFLGQQLQGVKPLDVLTRANVALMRALTAVDPFVVGATFADQMQQCQYSSERTQVVCAPLEYRPACTSRPIAGYTFVDCDWTAIARPAPVLPPYVSIEDSLSPYGLALRAGSAARETAKAVWTQGWLTRIVIGVALTLAVLLAAVTILQPGGAGAIVWWLIYLPTAVGLLAWLLKFGLLALTLAFSAVLGLIAWIGGALVLVWRLVELGRKAEEIEIAGLHVRAWWRARPARPPDLPSPPAPAV